MENLEKTLKVRKKTTNDYEGAKYRFRYQFVDTIEDDGEFFSVRLNFNSDLDLEVGGVYQLQVNTWAYQGREGFTAVKILKDLSGKQK